MSDWFVDASATEPSVVTMIATENRVISINLGAAMLVGEVVEGTPTVDIVEWGTRNPVDASALSSAPGYNAGTKILAQRVDASKLPKRTPVALRASFTVNAASGLDDRATYVIIRVVV